MLNPLDLRLQNWILDNGKPVQVTMLSIGVTFYCINGVNLDKKTGRELVASAHGKATVLGEDRFSGIDLIPDVYLNCNAKDCGGWMGKFVNTEIDGELISYVFELNSGVLRIHVNDITIRKYEKPYLHELQNIYEDLTGFRISYHPSTISETTE